jgi:hypothetical protein
MEPNRQDCNRDTSAEGHSLTPEESGSSVYPETSCVASEINLQTQTVYHTCLAEVFVTASCQLQRDL